MTEVERGIIKETKYHVSCPLFCVESLGHVDSLKEARRIRNSHIIQEHRTAPIALGLK